MSIQRALLSSIDKVASALPPALLKSPTQEDGTPLAPSLQVIRQLRKLVAFKELQDIGAAKARKRIHNDLVSLQISYPIGHVQDIQIPLPGRSLAARHYQPKNSGTTKPMLMVYFHGGGYVAGDIDTHDDVCRLLCRETGMQLISVQYRQPPEHPLPAPLDDAIEALQWAQLHAADFGVSADQIAVGGDSAGATLATIAAQHPDLTHPVVAQLLLYPGADAYTHRPSKARYSKGYFLSSEESTWFCENYVGTDAPNLSDPRVSPLLGATSPQSPPALVVTAGFDVLRDEGQAYADKLSSLGVPTTLQHYPQLVHAFANFAAVHKESEAAVVDVAKQFTHISTTQVRRKATAA